MYLNPRSISYIWHHRHRLLRAQLISTNASVSSLFSSPARFDSLHQQILSLKDSSTSVVPILNQWLQKRKRFDLRELRICIKKLREFRRYNHALQVLEWSLDQSDYKLTPPDVAVRLQLISKIHGVEKAEEYFKSIPESLRNYQVCGALLHCYPRTEQFKKAEALFESMKDMGFVRTADWYHTLLNIYTQMGKSKKLSSLRQEMEEKSFKWTVLTYNVWLRAYVACSDIEGMEKILVNMEENSQIKMNFDSCVIAAKGYLKTGQFEKTLKMLKRSEKLISDGMRIIAYETILGLYAAIGNKTDVYRLCELHKRAGRVSNTGYLCMISALLKLGELDGAEKIWEEWYSERNSCDIRIPNLMINAYSRMGSMEKAEACVNKIVEKGKEPNADSWYLLVGGYILDGQMTKAVDTIKKAILKSKSGMAPRFSTLFKCIQYLKDQGEKEGAEALLKMTIENFDLSTASNNQLLQWRSTLRNHPCQLSQSRPSLAAPSSSPETEPLYLRISRLGDPSLSVVPILDQWLKETKRFQPCKLRKAIKKLYELHHYNHALQLSDWLTEQKGFQLSSKDIEIRLGLISKVHSLEKAEEYYSSLPEMYRRGFGACNALLNFYASANRVEKAESVLKSMKDLGITKLAIPYRTMCRLYNEKLNSLSQEMEENNMISNTSDFNNRLQAYVANSDIEAMEKLLANTKATRKIKLSFHSCILAAKGYLKAGLVNKALTMLTRSEKVIQGDGRIAAYNALIPLYAAIASKNDVYRLCKFYG